ncbi:MAG: hypothetical protein M3Y78_13730, partial [Pseudomonadota bacterium]|nr:hypothetical protein [Pseudomonadota bacterium]
FAMLALLACQPAFASGGVHCAAEGDGVTFEVGGGVSRGMGAALFSFEGRLEMADKAIAADLGRTEFAREHVAQYWLDGEELRLLLYRERQGDMPHGYVELTIETQARAGDDGEGMYDGSYMLRVFDMTDENGGEGVTVSREGAVECFAE